MADRKKLSYTCSPNTFPFIYETVPDRLRHLAADDPEREAFIFYNLDQQRTSLTRKQLLDQSTNTAKNFIKSGMKKGSSVAICMSNSLEILVASMGVIMAGGVPFYVSTNLKDGNDLLESLNSLEARFLFIDTDVGDENWKILEIIWPTDESRSKTAPSLEMVICCGRLDEETDTRKSLASFQMEKTDDNVTLPTLQPEDTFAIFCSSGSTGKPKNVIYTHYGILNWTKSSDITLNISEKSVFFCDRTVSWVLGFPRTYLTEGATRVFVDIKLSIAGKHTEFLCNIIKTEKCDVVYLPGYMAVDILRNTDTSADFCNVKTIFLAGERIQKTNFEAVKKHLCKQVISYYGTTETGGVCAFSGTNGEEFEDGMIGKPLLGVEMKVVDDTGSVVPTGSQGELCIRCTWRFTGYRNLDDLYREKVDDQSWFHTGDVAHIREDGNCIIDGRIQELISTGTNKYFPWTVERGLKNIQGAQNVFAVGVPDPRLGQVVCACVFPKQGVSITEADVRKLCDDTFLEESTSFGVSIKPRYHIIMDNVPLTSSGKIDRRSIGLQAKEKLGL